MIIFRYLLKEVLLSVLSVTLVVLLVVMSGRFISYLTEAADGRLSPEVLLPLIGYRIPGLLELILPLGLLLGILLAYGRLYLDNEMTVLHACGLSDNQLQQYTLAGGLVVALLVAILSLWLSPWANGQIEQIRNSQEELTEFDTVTEGRFQYSDSGSSVSYVARLNAERTRLENVFVASRQKGNEGEPKLRVINAQTGEQYFSPETGDRFVLLKEGYEYIGLPGQADYQRTHFEQYAIRLEETAASYQLSKLASIPTLTLLASDRPSYQAQLHWRLSVPLVSLLVVVLGVALSKVDNRQGRFGRILPSILLYIGYLTALTSVRAAIEKGTLDSVAYLWLIHLLFATLVLSFHYFQRQWAWLLNSLFGVLSLLVPRRRLS